MLTAAFWEATLCTSLVYLALMTSPDMATQCRFKSSRQGGYIMHMIGVPCIDDVPEIWLHNAALTTAFKEVTRGARLKKLRMTESGEGLAPLAHSCCAIFFNMAHILSESLTRLSAASSLKDTCFITLLQMCYHGGPEHMLSRWSIQDKFCVSGSPLNPCVYLTQSSHDCDQVTCLLFDQRIGPDCKP